MALGQALNFNQFALPEEGMDVKNSAELSR